MTIPQFAEDFREISTAERDEALASMVTEVATRFSKDRSKLTDAEIKKLETELYEHMQKINTLVNSEP